MRRSCDFANSANNKMPRKTYQNKITDKSNTGIRKDFQRKRKRSLNRHECENENNVSASARKIKKSSYLEPSINNDIDYVLLNFVFSFISEYVKCKDYGEIITFAKTSIRGLDFKVKIECPSCSRRSASSCPNISCAYEINT